MLKSYTSFKILFQLPSYRALQVLQPKPLLPSPYAFICFHHSQGIGVSVPL